jgi:hypothetical protein
MAEPTIALEVCQAEFERFTEAMGLELYESGMAEEDRKSFVVARERLFKAMQAGSLVIDESGRAVFTPVVGDRSPIVFHEPSGASLMAMDQKKTGHDVGKMFAFMADATKQPPSRFAGMANRDLKVCQSITMLFLG